MSCLKPKTRRASRREALVLIACSAVASLGLALLPCCASGGKPVPLIGVLMVSDSRSRTLEGLTDALARGGFVAGATVNYAVSNAEGDVSKLPDLARRLAAMKPSVLCPLGGAEAEACYAAVRGTGIPIVYAGVTSPVELGLAASLLEPLPGITGVRTGAVEMTGKRLQITRLFFPEAKTVTVVFDPSSVPCTECAAMAREVAPRLGLVARLVPVRDAGEVAEFAGRLAAEGHEVLLGAPCPLILDTRKDVLIPAATRAGVAFFGFDWEAVRDGALLAYGPGTRSAGETAARLVVRVLEGARAESLPVELAREIGLAVNLRQAQAMGIALPPKLLAMADMVVR